MGFLRFLFRRTVVVRNSVPTSTASKQLDAAARPPQYFPRRDKSVVADARTIPAPPQPKPFRYPERDERARRAQAVCDAAKAGGGKTLRGKCYVIDGDTIVIDLIHIRLEGIDAPELDQPYGKVSKWALHKLCKDQVVTAQINGELSHNRVVATCFLPDGRDLAAELVRQGLALDWAAFSGGKYRGCEPPDARRKMWKTAVRQKPTAYGQRRSRASGFSAE